jgi:3-hydroxyisobutyrate dehydrogenase-like beta-hydroxyacid dehydrogenase
MRIGFLGTGLMGTGFVRGLLGRGHDVIVWNRTAARLAPLVDEGAQAATSPAEAAHGIDRLFLSLSDDRSVDDTLEAALGALAVEVPIVDLSTTAPFPTRARGERLAAAGRPFLHAPVFMGPENARKAEGLMLVSGPEALYTRLEPELASMTGRLSYCGPDLARAAAFKLFGNSMGFAVIAGLADVLAMAKVVGIEPMEAVGFLAKLQPGRQIEYRGERMARGDFTATFELGMARKDVRLALETVGGVPLAVLPAIAARMDALIAAGYGADDLGALGKGGRA